MRLRHLSRSRRVRHAARRLVRPLHRSPAEQGDLQDVQRRLDRLVDALADGSLPTDEIKARLNAEKTRKTALVAELERLDRLGQASSVDAAELKRSLRDRVADVTGLLGRHTVQARQMLRKILADKIELEPVGSGRQRGFRFRGALTIERLIGGEALQTSLAMVAPRGIGSQASLFQLLFDGLALSG